MEYVFNAPLILLVVVGVPGLIVAWFWTTQRLRQIPVLEARVADLEARIQQVELGTKP